MAAGRARARRTVPAPAITEALHLARARRGHGQREAAAAVGVTQAAWGKWERGDTAPATRHLPALARYCEVSVPELLQQLEAAPVGDDGGELARLRALLEVQEHQLEASLKRIEELTATLLQVLHDRRAS
jgi:transcriptional regulator with XRE-family HTH domain